MTISTDRMEKGLRYMAETDVQFGMLKGLVDDMDYRLKVCEAQGIIGNKGAGAQDLVKSLARTSDEYKKLIDEKYQLVMEMEIIEAKRHTEELIFEAWRSINSNRRSGIVV